MRRRRGAPGSLRSWLALMAVACWIVPVAMVSVTAGMMINAYYGENLQSAVAAGTQSAMRQLEMRLTDMMEDSRSVSYEGEVRSLYRDYLQNGDSGALYRGVRDYLARKFSRSERFDSVHLAFCAEGLESVSYIIAGDSMPYAAMQRFRAEIEPRALACAQGSDTGIYFLEDGGELYMVRNILDSRFEPYATLAMLCDTDALFQSFEAIAGVTRAELSIDGIALELKAAADAPAQGGGRLLSMDYASSVEGHALNFRAQMQRMNVWEAIPRLKWMLLTIALLILPLLGAVVLMFYRHVSEPISALVEASDRVQSGERGYEISAPARNLEFAKIYRHFNAMSQELKNQFERQYLEQQALQQAKLRALQSQIDPHFLNNTLEVVNWQARMEGNGRVCAMLEALSTMMNASIGRDGRSRIPLREELSYADAYLYIISERLGERLRVRKQIDEALLELAIPRLSLQPLIENAINHDIAQRGGELELRALRQGEALVLEVEHDGQMSETDAARIRDLLSDVRFQPENLARRVGIRNVNQRLHLLYGGAARLSIEERAPGRILARIEIPLSLC